MPVVQQASNILEHRARQFGLGVQVGQRQRIVHRALLADHQKAFHSGKELVPGPVGPLGGT